MFNINIANYRSAKQNQNKIPPCTPIRMATREREKGREKEREGGRVGGSIDKDGEKLEPLCTVGGTVKWCNSKGKQYKGTSKIKHRTINMIKIYQFICTSAVCISAY